MKLKVFCILLALVALLCACSDNKDEVPTATGEPKTEPATGGTPSESFKYSELPEDYTPEQALADGCLVIEWEEGETSPKVSGIDYWEYFLETTRRSENISLRVVYFNTQRCWFTDFYYSGGQYILYNKDIYSENQVGPYKYLTEINGEDVYSGEEVSCFVLTDDEELGAEQALSIMHICDIEAERDVAFHIIDFTTYFG